MPSPYCDTLRSNPLQLTCRQDQRAVAVCNLQRFPNPLPPEYQVTRGPSTASRIDLKKKKKKVVTVLIKKANLLNFFLCKFLYVSVRKMKKKNPAEPSFAQG